MVCHPMSSKPPCECQLESIWPERCLRKHACGSGGVVVVLEVQHRTEAGRLVPSPRILREGDPGHQLRLLLQSCLGFGK